jgi:MinD-like ATPase involved in chromosome partitioning or flagellar assembly
MAQQETSHPTVRAIVRSDSTGVLVIEGTSHEVVGNTDTHVREQILTQVTGRARMYGRPVMLITEDAMGQGQLIISPDGSVEAVGDFIPAEPEVDPEETVQRVEVPPAYDVERVPPPPVVNPAPIPTATNAAAEQTPPQTTISERRAARASFLEKEAPEQPATQGWRGVLARAGIQLAPSEAELAERRDVQAVSQHWPGPRTIAIVNGKGGANKTPTTALLSAVFARYGGSGVLAWDNNETRGTLGWRTEQGPHEATVHNLLPETERLLSPAAQSSDLAHFVHHQTGDKYDVLRSNPQALSADQRISRVEFDALHQVASKYFRLIFIDSGNDESAERWQQMIDRSDQLVIATTALGEHAEAGALLLDGLAQRDERSAALADNAVVIVSQSEKSADKGDAQQIANGFASIARRVVTIPFDEALHSGKIRYDALNPVTQHAWLAAAAAVADGL